jgi:hypothetical protein
MLQVGGAAVSMHEVVRTEGCVKIYTKKAIDNDGHLLYKYIIRKINLWLQ